MRAATHLFLVLFLAIACTACSSDDETTGAETAPDLDPEIEATLPPADPPADEGTTYGPTYDTPSEVLEGSDDMAEDGEWEEEGETTEVPPEGDLEGGLDEDS